jgi:hypothetical protein
MCNAARENEAWSVPAVLRQSGGIAFVVYRTANAQRMAGMGGWSRRSKMLLCMNLFPIGSGTAMMADTCKTLP